VNRGGRRRGIADLVFLAAIDYRNLSGVQEMKHLKNTWCDLVQGSEGILRHFDAIADLEPLLLINLNLHSQTLEIELVSFVAPKRYASKWSNELDGGTRLSLVGSTNCLNINEPAYCSATSIDTSCCMIQA